MCSLYQCFRNTHSKWLCVDPLWKFIVLNCPQNFSFLIGAVAVCWAHSSPGCRHLAPEGLKRIFIPCQDFYSLCSPKPEQICGKGWELWGFHRWEQISWSCCWVVHTQRLECVTCLRYTGWGKWSLALIFNHTFDSEKSNPLSRQFSSIQFRRKRKKINPNYQVA